MIQSTGGGWSRELWESSKVSPLFFVQLPYPKINLLSFVLKTGLLSPPLLLHHIFYVSTIHHGSNSSQDNNANVLGTGGGNIGRGFRVGEVLKCGRGFTLKVNFPRGKNLCAQEWGEGEIIVLNAAMNQNRW